MVMGVTYGKKSLSSCSLTYQREYNPQHASTGSRTHMKGPVHCAPQKEVVGQQAGEDLGLRQEQDQQGDMQTPASLPEDQEESSDLIIPRKLINPIKLSKNHRELHKELKMTYKRTGSPEKPELQRVLEKRNWEQVRRQKREEEAKRNRSPFHQELLKRQQRLEELERELDLQQTGQDSSPEFIRVRESLRRTTILDVGEKKV